MRGANQRQAILFSMRAIEGRIPADHPLRVNYPGEQRSNRTHLSVTDPDARVARKSQHTVAILAYQASVLTENCHGLIVQTDVRSPHGHAEGDAALEMLTVRPPRRRRRTLGAGRGYDGPKFVADVRRLGFAPHVSPNSNRYPGRQNSAVDRRTTRQPGYVITQRKRKLAEQRFEWQKSVGVLHKLHHRGREIVRWLFAFTSAAYNLIRLRALLAPQLVGGGA